MSEPYSALVRASKCRWGPVTLPVAPERPICAPGVTACPTETPMDDRWPYWVYVPSFILITIWLPYDPPQPASTTVPEPTAWTVVPVEAWKSMPVWLPEDHRELLAS
ncbi:hypothetical protein SALBM311S_00972 [Streptomyces alboniger]